MSGIEDVQSQRKDYRHPHSGHNPIPTISGYREEQQRRDERYGIPDDQEETNERSRRDKLGDAYNAFTGKDDDNAADNGPTYPAVNKNTIQDEPEAEDHAGQTHFSKNTQSTQDQGSQDGFEDTTEGSQYESNPKKARKKMKKFNADGTKREVTDPITHLPVTIHDFTDKDLKSIEVNNPPVGFEPKTRTGTDGIEKTDEHFEQDQQDSQDSHAGMQALFPPPDFDATRNEITTVYMHAVTVGLGVIAVSLITVSALFSPTRHTTNWTRHMFRVVEYASMLGISAGIIIFMRQWTANRIKNVWDVEVWHAERKRGRKLAKGASAESAQWLNSLLASVWPLINPDLFTSIADTLEDVMQASLPSMVRMVAVEDLGQGSEAIRILGVRWLPTGAAARSVGADGKLKSADEEKGDRTVQDNGEGEDPDAAHDTMEAEEGDFVNVEVAFAYRPSTGRGIKSRAKRAHLLLSFYLPGKVKLPVWVQLSGFVGVVRLRLQLTPDPPFFSICTLSFLGQPRVTLGCVPLIKKGPNLMDVPLISSFVQSSIDAALAEYVAPKSLTLDLKDMMMGDDFKKDTLAQGVFVVRIKHAYDFKEGDASFGPLIKGSADPYVSVAWAKFGKPLWSTRVLQKNMEPYWDETCFVLVTSAELDVDEKLRIQLWDSDRTTADDDLGRIELDIKEVMKSKETNGKMCDRDDGFRAVKAGEPMPGRLVWSIGYFSKNRITDEQLTRQEEDPNIKTIEQLKKKVYADAEKKLREATEDHRTEVEQQKAQDFKERQDQLIIASPPSEDYPSGILSIQIHQITGLELEVLNKTKAEEKGAAEDEDDGDDHLPSAYCTIILNHKKIFKTRTKPKNAKPFFNAGCERFIRDVRNTEVHIAVRDNRVHEDDPLLGIIYLPLEKVFHQRSQVNSVFPLSGGVGYGRARVSMVFRSVQVQIPRNLLGWEYGTLDIKSGVKAINLPKDLQPLRMKVRSTLAKDKLHSRRRNGRVNEEDGQAVWTTRGDRPIRLPVRMRYSSPLVVEFRQDATLRDHTPAFGILWLKDIPDNEQTTIRLPIWKGDLKRAENNILTSCGEQVGEVEMTLTFWSGLSGYHNGLAKGDKHLRQVMEVLDICNDQEWSDWDDSDHGDNGAPNLRSSASHDDDSSSSSSSDDDEDPKNSKPDFLTKHRKTDSKLSEDGKRSTLDSLRDYKQHTKELHRKNRGIMQWKGPRTLAWVKHVAGRGTHKVSGLFHHHDRDGVGIETEV
ncbi:meiotically up-regulated gene 190 protein [Dothidotthia symphoricarpi CBS 119687]|uniref:Meiotically up-regulated gene 190 protein n=1 Tax=Dothidotthia symphoricarpi CBS 119687 TaxID=1392245 RepID=A0A6A6ATG6_9PLEO|nr:meiotically up-regulated gene 190 protein [Dothidotthia symphoricarpi CBS 119687]KAF2134147.1 meiotically up-regulated gene 190 protein [Dothidotthia symphoricarpi CBS 119687]